MIQSSPLYTFCLSLQIRKQILPPTDRKVWAPWPFFFSPQCLHLWQWRWWCCLLRLSATTVVLPVPAVPKTPSPVLFFSPALPAPLAGCTMICWFTVYLNPLDVRHPEAALCPVRCYNPVCRSAPNTRQGFNRHVKSTGRVVWRSNEIMYLVHRFRSKNLAHASLAPYRSLNVSYRTFMRNWEDLCSVLWLPHM